MKNHLQNNFDRAEGFSEHRQLQKKVEANLISLSKEFCKPGLAGCELGCAGGNVIKWLSTFNKKVVAIDISAGQLQRVKEDIRNEDIEPNFIQTDLDSYLPPPQSFSYLFSSLTLHWINDISACLHRLSVGLEKGGVLAVAVPIETTLMENRQYLWENYNFDAFNTFPSIQTIFKGMDKLKVVSCATENITITYPHWSALFSNFVKLGVQTKINNRESIQRRASKMKNILQERKKINTQWRIFSFIAINV